MGGLAPCQPPQHHNIMRKVFEFCLGIFIFLVATAFIPAQTFAVVQGHVFKIGIVALFVMSLYLKPLRWISNVWINSIIALALVVTLSLDMQAKMATIEGLVLVLLGAILLYTVIQHLENKKVVLYGISAVVIMNVFMAICQLMKIDPICLNDGGLPNTHIVGLFGFKYVFGAWMAIAAPYLLFNRKIVLGTAAAILTVLSLSWAAVLVMGIALIFGTFFINKKLFVSVIIISSMLAATAMIVTHVKYDSIVTYYRDSSTNEREADGGHKLRPRAHPMTLKYKAMSRMLLEAKFLPVLMSKPYTGYGIGSFKYVGPRIDTRPYGTMLDAWNDYLERGIECGIGMIALLIMLFITTIRRFLKSDRRMALASMAALVTVPIGMLLHDYFNHYSLTAIMIILFAVYEITIKESYEDKVCGQ